MKVRIEPSRACGKVVVPPSKSYAHRYLITSMLSNGTSTISNVALSSDILASIECVKALGKKISILDDTFNKKIIIENSDSILNDEIILNCFESGSTMRFFIPIALTTGKKVKVIGSEKLISRGISPYEEICKQQNIQVIKDKTSITFTGKLKKDEFLIPGNISSQFISGLLFALPLLDGDSKIILSTELESKDYVDITIDCLNKANIKIDTIDNVYYIKGLQQYSNGNYLVEGDYSNAAFLEAFNYFGGNVELVGLNINSLQGDKKYQEYFKLLDRGYQTIDITNNIDLGPILFAFASMKHGGLFKGVSRLRIKESNRILDVLSEIEKFGSKFAEFDNIIRIDEQILTKPKNVLNGKNDHRIVMMLTVMASVYGGIIEGIEAVNKSYPNFFKDIEALGIEVKYDD